MKIGFEKLLAEYERTYADEFAQADVEGRPRNYTLGSVGRGPSDFWNLGRAMRVHMPPVWGGWRNR